MVWLLIWRGSFLVQKAREGVSTLDREIKGLVRKRRTLSAYRLNLNF